MPNIPSLSVTPNGDGTATATVTGSSAGSTNTIEVVSLGITGSESWTSAGSCTGDGNVTLTLSNGSYLARCQSTLAGVAALDSSNAYLFTMSGGSQTSYNSPHAALLYSVQSKIIGLLGTRITGVVSDSVIVRASPYAQDFFPPNNKFTLPGILIAPWDREKDFGGTNVRDDIGYPVLLLIVSTSTDSRGVTDFQTVDPHLTVRQTLSDVLRMQGLVVTNYAPQNPLTFYVSDVDYQPIVDWNRLQVSQLLTGALKLTWRLRKSRG